MSLKINETLLRALKNYVDKKIEYEFAHRETGADGYGVSALDERKAAEQAWEDVERINNEGWTTDFKVMKEEKMEERHCQGCEQNFYNGNNPMGIKRCRSFEKAELVMKKRVSINDVPPWKHTPIQVPSCYHVNGYIFVDPEKEF